MKVFQKIFKFQNNVVILSVLRSFWSLVPAESNTKIDFFFLKQVIISSCYPAFLVVSRKVKRTSASIVIRSWMCNDESYFFWLYLWLYLSVMSHAWVTSSHGWWYLRHYLWLYVWLVALLVKSHVKSPVHSRVKWFEVARIVMSQLKIVQKQQKKIGKHTFRERKTHVHSHPKERKTHVHSHPAVHISREYHHILTHTHVPSHLQTYTHVHTHIRTHARTVVKGCGFARVTNRGGDVISFRIVSLLCMAARVVTSHEWGQLDCKAARVTNEGVGVINHCLVSLLLLCMAARVVMSHERGCHGDWNECLPRYVWGVWLHVSWQVTNKGDDVITYALFCHYFCVWLHESSWVTNEGVMVTVKNLCLVMLGVCDCMCHHKSRIRTLM